MNGLVAGAIVAGYAVAGLFFLRFWWRTRDPLFACFAAAFAILAGHRLGLALTAERNEDDTAFYAARLLAFLLILLGIWRKNRAAKPKS